MFEGHPRNQRIYHEFSFPIGEGREDTRELRKLITDFLSVVGDSLQGGDLILHRPQALLALALLLGQAIHLAVDKPYRLGGQASAGKPPAELLPP
jgi:hypothetical protein